MLTLLPNDFLQMVDFPLRWRWTDSKWNLLPADILASIRPLKKQKAHQLDTLLANLLKPIPIRVATSTGAKLQSAVDTHAIESFNSSAESSEGYKWLYKILPSHDGDAYVSWDVDTAALVRLATFIEYWDDFCYPLSHDVIVVPMSGKWILYYWHEEVLYFWNR